MELVQYNEYFVSTVGTDVLVPNSQDIITHN